MATVPRISQDWASPSDDPIYRSRDGKPMSDNGRQYAWISTLKGGIESLFLDRPDVWVAGNCLWYPVKGQPKVRMAPDTMIVFGRPRGYRGSYIQHREGGVPVQVAFEVLSPGNRAGEMRRKLDFYQRHGVEEYYILDPDFRRHKGYLRSDAGVLEPIADLFGWVSPRLGIRFELTDELIIFGPDGRPLEFYEKLYQQRDLWEQRADLAQQQADESADEARLARQQAQQARRRLEAERHRAEQAQQQADAERRRAEAESNRAEQAQQQADAERRRAERLRDQLRALGIDPDDNNA